MSILYYICPNLNIVGLEGYTYIYSSDHSICSTDAIWCRVARFFNDRLSSHSSSFSKDEFLDQVCGQEFTLLASANYAWEALKQRDFIRDQEYPLFLAPQVSGPSGWQVDEWERAKAEAGLLNSPIEVVLVKDYLDEAMCQLNRDRYAEGASWVPVCLYGENILIGPVFSPEDGCYECLRQRLIDCQFPARHYYATRELYRRSRELIGRDHPFTGFFQRSLSSAYSGDMADAVAGLVKRYLEDYRSGKKQFGNSILKVNAKTQAMERHPNLPFPQCDVCGDPTLWWPERPDLTESSSDDDSSRWRSWSGEEAAAVLKEF